jgi:hypothetical protein
MHPSDSLAAAALYEFEKGANKLDAPRRSRWHSLTGGTITGHGRSRAAWLVVNFCVLVITITVPE